MSEYDISKAFKRIENELIDSMMRNLKRHKAEELKEGFNWEQWQVLQLKELERYRAENLSKFQGDFNDINQKIMTQFFSTYNDAQTKQESLILDKVLTGDFKPIQTKDTTFFNLNDDKLNILLERTKADFTRAEYAVLRKAEDEYRKIIFDAQVYANVTNDYDGAVDMATHDMLFSGIQSIVYKNGSKHNLSEYARMAIRTGNKRAYLMGEGNARDEYGIHTVRVNKRTQACPKCVGFLGKVLVDDVYSGGTAKEAEQAGVPTLSQAIAQGFLHPNCKDIYSTYLEGVSKPATPWTKDEIEEIVGDYNQEQAINHAEDMRDSYARMAKYALSPDNKTKYQARADAWQERINEIKSPPKPVAPPVVIQPPKPKKKADDVSEKVVETVDRETEIRNLISEIKSKSVGKLIKEAEAEKDNIKDYVSTYNQLKWRESNFGDSIDQQIKERLEDLTSSMANPNNSAVKDIYAESIKRYEYIRDHIQEFENGTATDGITKRIKVLKKQETAVQKELNTAYAELEGVIGEPNVTKLAKYKEKNTTAIKHFLDDAPVDCRNLWNEFADNFKIIDGSGKAYYSAGYSGVHLSITSASKGTSHQTPYQVVFHEYGHAIDWELNRKYGNGKRMESFTRNYKDGIFGKTVQKEANEAIEKFAIERNLVGLPNRGTVVIDADDMVRRGILRQDERNDWIRKQLQTVQVDRIQAEKEFSNYIKKTYSLLQRTDISDMFESVMTTMDYPFGVGHGKRYWKKDGASYIACGQEAFAEMYSAVIANGESWEVIQKYFPESVKIFNEILEVIKL